MSDVKQFTYADLEEHKSRNSLWLTIHKKVYDVTAFLDEVSVFLPGREGGDGGGIRV